MNLRKVWTEVFQKPAGRLLLFLVIGGIFLAFILLRREPQPKPDNTQVGKPATQTKAYSFNEEISPPTRAQATPAERASDKMARATPPPKPPPSIPQTIFATKEQSISELFLPYGRMLRCELVNTVDSTNIDTPIVGLVIEDAWNDGRLIIQPAPKFTEPLKSRPSENVSAPTGNGSWCFRTVENFLFRNRLDCAPDPKKPDAWQDTDGSAGLHGYFVKSDKYAEAKAILASMISAGRAHFLKRQPFSRRSAARRKIDGRGSHAFSAGQGEDNSTRSVSWSSSIRIPSTSEFPPAPPFTSTSHDSKIARATVGLSASLQPSSNP